MATHLWSYIRDIAQNIYRRHSSQRLATDGSEIEDSGEDGLHGHESKVNSGHDSRSKSYAEITLASMPSWPYWFLLAVLAAIAFAFGVQATGSFFRTNLIAEVLTKDGKDFPHGQLSYSVDFSPLPCGNTPSEAIARGCHFDMVATAWLPPRCIDTELMEEFLSEHPWRFYADQQGRSGCRMTPIPWAAIPPAGSGRPTAGMWPTACTCGGS
ncbi:uncharacterized protein PG998_013122 [Apiospora kogelbergensis]|uniref:uncharacterized protein n=1 Tax=Apiospora kogelbergensis TaxID=1337665 RepID=UPI0031317977